MKTRCLILALVSLSLGQFAAAAAAPTKVAPTVPTVPLVSRQTDRQAAEPPPDIPRPRSRRVIDLVLNGGLVSLSASASSVEVGLKGESTAINPRLTPARAERPAAASYCVLQFRF